MMPLRSEPVTIARTSEELPGLVDPEADRIYFTAGADVLAGDIASFRGVVRRVTDVPFLWSDAGLVAVVEKGPPLLPDYGELLRGGGYSFNPETGDREPVAPTVLWAGPCKVASDPYAFDRYVDIGDQRVGTTPVRITVPLSVTEGQDNDQFRVTSSRDLRLVTRVFTIKSVRVSSDELFREMLAFDNLGD